jgi:hypothetical protein
VVSSAGYSEVSSADGGVALASTMPHE